MPRLRWFVPPVVGAAVHVPDRCGDELRRVEVVERGKADRNVVAADLGEMSPPKRRDPALLAERSRSELAGGEAVTGFPLAREQAKCVRLDVGAPPAHLPAVSAVAFARARREIDVRLEANF